MNAAPDNQPRGILAGRTIVITRARAQSEAFAAELEALGAQVVVCPTIEITDPDSYERLDEAIEHIYGYDWILFTSANGVDYFFRRFSGSGHQVVEVDSIKVCAVGEATAVRLHDLNVHVDVIPDEFKAEGVYRALEQFVGGSENLNGLNILLPRATVARDFLPKALEAAGARIDVVPAYKTIAPAGVDRARLVALLPSNADCIAFTSSSSVRNLAQLFDTQDLSSILPGVAIACIGDVTKETANDYGLQVHILPDQSTVSALVQAIAAHFTNQ